MWDLDDLIVGGEDDLPLVYLRLEEFLDDVLLHRGFKESLPDLAFDLCDLLDVL